MELSFAALRDATLKESPTGTIRRTWDRLHRLPGGKRVFSKMIGRSAPYTGSIGAVVQELCEGYSLVELQDRRHVRNHLQCVHAIALTNLAELTASVAIAYGLPTDARFIVAGLSIDYIKKARGTIRASCECPTVTTNKRREYTVPVVMRDGSGDIVATSSVRTLVGPTRGTSG